jgi:hypothetical protein
VFRSRGYGISDWPADYIIHIMPPNGDDYEAKVANIAEGHGGGECRIFVVLFKGTLTDNDPLGHFASAEDEFARMINGASVNESAWTSLPVRVNIP